MFGATTNQYKQDGNNKVDNRKKKSEINTVRKKIKVHI